MNNSGQKCTCNWLQTAARGALRFSDGTNNYNISDFSGTLLECSSHDTDCRADGSGVALASLSIDAADASRIGRYAMKTDSSPALAFGTRGRNETPAREIALWRIYLLRAGYLLIAVGMGMQKVPAFLHHRPWELMHGVVNSMLFALVLLAVLGLRYPLKMLPLLFWEIAWKATWLLAVALPAWQNHTMDADTWDTTFACLMSVIFLFVVPWDYVWRNFVAARGDRWW